MVMCCLASAVAGGVIRGAVFQQRQTMRHQERALRSPARIVTQLAGVCHRADSGGSGVAAAEGRRMSADLDNKQLGDTY